MKEFAVYTLARLGMFVASYAVVVGVWLLVTGGHTVPILLPLLVAGVMSAVASVYLLRAPRERFAAKVDERATRMASRFEEARASEDDQQDAR